MVKIIFSRVGKKKNPQYRIIALDKKKDPWGNFLEILGHFNPHTKELTLKNDRIEHWLSQGAQPSDTVHNILVEQGIVKNKKKTVSRISKKRQEKLAEKEKENKEKKESKEEVKEAPKAEKTEEKPAEETKTEQPEEKVSETKENPKTEEKKAE
jgi:small subunit ribosomal protein S16